MSKRRKWALALGALVLVGLLYVGVGLRVDNAITDDDRTAIATLDVDDECTEHTSFEAEFACIEAVQIAVQAIGEKRCPRRGVNVEPLDFMARNHGCCYDRARFIEKALRHYGFETRHLALIQPYRGISLLDFVPLGQSSHATTEVLTSRGWLGVDSNWPLILIDDAGTTFTYRDAIASEYFRDSWVPQWFYRGELDYFYGLYSRHGFAFGIDAPGPEWAFSEVRHNF